MYMTVSNIPGVVAWRWIERRKASEGGMTWPACKQFIAILLQVSGHCLVGRENYF